MKVADATLSRDLYDLDYYQPGEKARALPVKWMSPEALEHELFTSRGDVVGFKTLFISPTYFRSSPCLSPCKPPSLCDTNG